MKTLSIIAATGLMTLCAIGSAQAQASGTPYSPFPNTAPHEIRIVSGVPCRTVLDRDSGIRIPVECAVPTDVIGMDPASTGGVRVAPPYGIPASDFPDAAQDEIRVINGFSCRTVLIEETGERVPADCVRR